MGGFRNNIQVAFASLSEHRQRAVLSALGITVASLAIVLLISIAKGIQADVSHQVDELGVNLLFVLPGRFGDDSMFAPGMLGISRLQESDVDQIRQLPGVRRATPLVFIGPATAGAKLGKQNVFAAGAGPDWFRMRPWNLKEGRLLQKGDDDKFLCLLGGGASEKLFGKTSALGRSITCGGRKYTVVGVTKTEQASDSLFGPRLFDDVAYVPFSTVKLAVPGAQINRILVQTRPDYDPKKLVGQIEALLSAHLDKDSYSVLTPQDLLKLIYKLMGILTWLLTGLTSIGLFIGGVGIMTVMLMSVNERAKEIGVRMTVGARRSDIFSQFLFEAAMLALGGGLAGLLLSYLADLALLTWTPIKPLITFGLAILSLGVCLTVGIVFGLIPAMKAARQQPIESLRHE